LSFNDFCHCYLSSKRYGGTHPFGMNTTPVGAAEGCDLLIFSSPWEPILSTTPSNTMGITGQFLRILGHQTAQHQMTLPVTAPHQKNCHKAVQPRPTPYNPVVFVYPHGASCSYSPVPGASTFFRY
jgi:hypothetical protein